MVGECDSEVHLEADLWSIHGPFAVHLGYAWGLVGFRLGVQTEGLAIIRVYDTRGISF